MVKFEGMIWSGVDRTSPLGLNDEDSMKMKG